MEKNIKFKDIDVFYNSTGKGKNTVVFLHGYLEAKEIWNEFAEKLSDKYKIIAIDMLGHGKTGTVSENHSMKLMTESVKAVLDTENVKECVLTGHSMGGYVTLEFVKNFSGYVKAFCLFHSHSFADTEEKKANRDREINLVKQGKYSQIVETNIPNMYAGGENTKFKDKLEFSKEIARKIKPEGVIAALNGMKNREDNFEILKNCKKPVLFIAGKKDNLIPFSPDDKQFTANKNLKLVVLEESGHMGMFEESEKAFTEFNNWLSQIF